MNWIVLSVKTTAAGADTVSALLMSCGAKGTQIVDRADIPDADRMTGFGELIDADLARMFWSRPGMPRPRKQGRP
jgi:ribosomal protein L11 methylase PrmA